ncbi:hypothetical protein LY76DRAFT_556740 [Colletotrichum caudatum]|nr:hypothetical protein LY76DRAFT_556740 [Colletotrichum caudatum]
MTYPSQYTSIMSPSDATGSSMLTQIVMQPPAAPASRAGKPVASVFPTIWQVQLSPFGNSFDGAYRDAKGNVYAVSGMVKMNDSTSIVNMLSAAPENLPVQNVNPAAEAMMAAPQPVFSSLVAADAGGTGAPPLQVFELLNLNPMVQDPTDPSGWRDSVTQLAMTDFHDLIVYFMDPDLRTTFVQASAPALTPAMLAIANDDAASGTGENKAFYQRLQVPFIVSMLAAGKFDQGKYCNGKRADARLKDIPSDDPVYKRHSSKLYRAHFIEKFPSITEFLRDQNQNDYTAKMDALATGMKNKIADKSAVLDDPVGNPNYDAQLAAAQKDIDDLIVWAKERSLFWALQLLYYVQTGALPNWYSQYTSGSNTNNLSMMQKQLNALFGLLENYQTNTKPGGRNFMQAYNDDMRLFQMTSIIPTLIDARGNSREIDNLIVECLGDYIEHFKASPNQDHVDAIAAAEQLYMSKELRDKFWIPLTAASRLGVAASSWQLTMTMWENTIRGAAWFKNMASGGKLLQAFQGVTAVAFILMPLLPGMWDQMSGVPETFLEAVDRRFMRHVCFRYHSRLDPLLLLWW